MLYTRKVSGVSRVEPSSVSVGRRSDQDVHDTRSRLATRSNDSGCKLAITGGDIIVDGQGVEPALKVRQSPQTLSANGSVSGNQHPKVQFSERHRTDRKFSLQGLHINGD